MEHVRGRQDEIEQSSVDIQANGTYDKSVQNRPAVYLSFAYYALSPNWVEQVFDGMRRSLAVRKASECSLNPLEQFRPDAVVIML